MYKNQLQELAQRSCFNLPAYSCIREGPDHAPRFKATVNFNGEIFESPTYCSTLRQAEHAAAEVALNTLSRRGPSQYLAARILDETGVCKNLLQETAQRGGVSLPVYTTIRSGPGHLPVFKCIVEVGGRTFIGDAAKTKKQAEKNAALAAWSAIKLLASHSSQLPLLLDSETCDELDRSSSNPAMYYRREERVSVSKPAPQVQSSQLSARRPTASVVNVRDKYRTKRDGSPAGRFYPGSSSSSSALRDRSSDAGHSHGRYFQYNQQPAVASIVSNTGPSVMATVQQRSHSLSCVDSPLLSRDAVSSSRAAVGVGNVSRLSMPVRQVRGLSLQSRSERFELKQALLDELNQMDGDEMFRGEKPIRGLPLQSRSERFELKPSLLEELHQRDEEEWLRGEIRGLPLQSRSERFELKPSLLEELHQRDEEEWLRGEISKSTVERESSGFNNVEMSSLASRTFSCSPSPSSSVWSRSLQRWGAQLPFTPSVAANPFPNLSTYRPASNLAPPVRVRQMVPVHSAPPPRTDPTAHRCQDSQSRRGVPNGSGEDVSALARQFSCRLSL